VWPRVLLIYGMLYQSFLCVKFTYNEDNTDPLPVINSTGILPGIKSTEIIPSTTEVHENLVPGQIHENITTTFTALKSSNITPEKYNTSKNEFDVSHRNEFTSSPEKIQAPALSPVEQTDGQVANSSNNNVSSSYTDLSWIEMGNSKVNVTAVISHLKTQTYGKNSTEKGHIYDSKSNSIIESENSPHIVKEEDLREQDTLGSQHIVDLMMFLCQNSYVSCGERQRGLMPSDCWPCSCDINTCVRGQNCCPDVDNETIIHQLIPDCRYVHRSFIDFKAKYISIRHHFGPANESVGRTYINKTSSQSMSNDLHQNHISSKMERLFPKLLYVDSCMVQYEGSQYYTRCRDNSSTFLSDYVPVIGPNSIVYRNLHCAFCNNVTLPTDMDILTNCLQLYGMGHLQDNITAFMELTMNCSVYFIPPSYSVLAPCDHTSEAGQVGVSNCGTHSFPSRYSAAIEYLCTHHDYMPTFLDSFTHAMYKNIFCYLCNNDVKDYTFWLRHNTPSSTVGKDIHPFNRLIVLSRDKMFTRICT